MNEIIGIVGTNGVINGIVTGNSTIVGTIESGLADIQQYTGSLVITPTQSTQVLPTRGLSMGDNLTINPIPSNYGKITWNGSTLTVT